MGGESGVSVAVGGVWVLKLSWMSAILRWKKVARESQRSCDGGMSLELGLVSSFMMLKSSLLLCALLSMRSLKEVLLAIRMSWWCVRLAFLRAAWLSGVCSQRHFLSSLRQVCLDVWRLAVN